MSPSDEAQHSSTLFAEPPDPVARAAAAAFGDIAHTMDGLRDQIENATAAISQAVVASAYEVELGRLFLRAQSYLEESATAAQQQAAQVIADARAEADRIVADARRTADEIAATATASRPALTADSIQLLERTVESFSIANAELGIELRRLLESLRPPAVVQSCGGDDAPMSAASNGHSESTLTTNRHAEPPVTTNGHVESAATNGHVASAAANGHAESFTSNEHAEPVATNGHGSVAEMPPEVRAQAEEAAPPVHDAPRVMTNAPIVDPYARHLDTQQAPVFRRRASAWETSSVRAWLTRLYEGPPRR